MAGFLLQQLVNALAISAIYALIALLPRWSMACRLIQLPHSSDLFMSGAHIAFSAGGWKSLSGRRGHHPGAPRLRRDLLAVGLLGVGIEATA
jgi:branched-subunit amino acid ABC-type transport system permease component